jgi:recombination protein RecA
VTTQEKLQKEVERLNKKYGHKTGALGSEDYKLNVIPTGVLALDYALGTGGWPLGHPVEVFGPPDIGKSSIIGFSAIRQAQSRGKLCGIVALEPGFDQEWAEENGVNPEVTLIARPDTGEDAFSILHDWVTSDVIDYIVFDSIGAVLRKSETETDGKAAQAGQAGLITWGVKRILQPAWKNNTGIMFLNQVRDVMGAHIPLLDSPGGHALEHSCAMRVQLKPGRERYQEKEGEDSIMVGRELVAVVVRNKMSKGTNRRARFDFYQKETDDHEVGIDSASDLLHTGLKTGTIRAGGSWYYHDDFPDGKLKGKPAIKEFLTANSDKLARFRNQILEVMLDDPNRVALGPPKEENERE